MRHNLARCSSAGDEFGHSRPSRSAHVRAFTLVELMVVVVIVGVLSTLAIYSVRKYIDSSKSAEALNMIGSIKAAQENFHDETFSYLNVSTNIDSLYPMTTPGRMKVMWGGAGDGDTNWATLGVTSNAPVQFGYACVAGLAGVVPPQPSDMDSAITWPTTTTKWYVIKALADVNGDGVKQVYVGSSFSDDIISSNEGE
jgi:prepilin-type N-terminal cleavage/methylation domain-containing protein